jgi:formylglycine-generating enzyme required for sulfatase activity
MKKTLFLSLVSCSVLFAQDYVNSIGMVFKDIPSGSFIMGTQIQSTANCPKDDPFTSQNENIDCVNLRTGDVSRDETPAHNVSIKSFYMGETEVTQGQWYEIMGDNPANFKTGDRNMPIENVSWDDVKKFIVRLNSKEGTTKYRLPTEEEWEYAARAGTTTKWYCGDNESCVNQIAVSKSSQPKPGKSKKSNNFGLYDMSGNVREWTDSCYSSTYTSSKDCTRKVNRGGNWSDYVYGTRSAYRSDLSSSNRDRDLGFRLLRTK